MTEVRYQNGHIWKENGAWYARWREDVLEDGRIVRKRKFRKLCDYSDRYRTKSDVRPMLDDIMRPLNAGKVNVESTMTLMAFVDTHWLPYIKTQVRQATEYGYIGTWERYLKPKFGNVPLRDIRKRDVIPYLLKLSTETGSRVAQYAKTLGSMIFNYAVQLEIVENNPFSGTKMLPRRKREQGYAVNINELAAMMAALRNEPQAKVALGLMFFGSLRPSEVRGAKWWNYDPRTRQLLVSCSRWRKSESDTKTEDATALVPVNDPLAKLLAELHERDGFPVDGYILRGERGGSLNLDNLSRRVIIPKLWKAGIEWHGYYSLRRGCGTMATEVMRDKGLAAKSLLRHKDLATTSQFYIASLPAEAREAVDLMAQQFELASKWPVADQVPQLSSSSKQTN